MNYLCSHCNIELSKNDHKALEIVSLGKLYCQDCLLEQCKHLFLDDKGHLNDKWDLFERLVIDDLVESYNDGDYDIYGFASNENRPQDE